MKTFTIILVSVLGFAGTLLPGSTSAQIGISASINFNTFYRQLSPYGQWRDIPRYGQVWIYSEPGFRPYATNGQWENTDDGWYWNSNYAWGDIPFHYGRWELDPYYGWIWIPGYDYAPAWVVWSETADCYGWAPLGYGLDISVSLGRIPSNRWMYASFGNINRPYIDRYCIPYNRAGYYYGRQRPIVNVYNQHNVRYMAGPRREQYRNDRFQPQRPPVRQDRYNDRSYGNTNYNNNNSPRRYGYGETGREGRDNNIHFDPSTQYNRNGAIAGGRPQPARERNNDAYDRGRVTGRQPRPQFNDMGARPQMTQPRVMREPQMQPQHGREAPRSMGGRERRIF